MELRVEFLPLPSVMKVTSPRLAEGGCGVSLDPCSVLLVSSVLTSLLLSNCPTWVLLPPGSSLEHFPGPVETILDPSVASTGVAPLQVSRGHCPAD